MAKNPKNNLKPFTKANARENQLKGAAKRVENNIERNRVYKCLQKFLLGKMTVGKEDLKEMGDSVDGFKVGKKALRVAVDFAKLREKTIRKGDVRGYIEVLKAAGFHFDQSAEALGGSENPINVNNRIGPPSDELKEAMAEQARLLGVVDDKLS